MVVLAEGQKVVSPIGEILSTPKTVHFPPRNPQGRRPICGKMGTRTSAHYSVYHSNGGTQCTGRSRCCPTAPQSGRCCLSHEASFADWSSWCRGAQNGAKASRQAVGHRSFHGRKPWSEESGRWGQPAAYGGRNLEKKNGLCASRKLGIFQE